MVKEYQSIVKNDVWDVVPRLEGKSIVTSKWIYKIKHATDGSTKKYKARFVACGFSQKHGIHYEETFAHVARYTSIRSVLSLAAKNEVESTLDGCQDNFLEWCSRRGSICGTATQF